MPNNLTIDLDNQEDEEVNAEDYSHISNPNKKNHSELAENFLIFGNISKLGMKLDVVIIKLLVIFATNFGVVVNQKG